ncbi:MAG: SDR family NAD(P)-dependent oxidoreductase, partial [SAR202 cluster bacterium]|nr:SDR family NAD(P)-dependent oxidoreductase [SAR202 cluster bacterium]
MMIDLSGKTALVTGGASGIGRGICLVLAEQGAELVVADINLEGAQSVASEVQDAGGVAISVRADVTDRDSIIAMIELALEQFGKIDILVNDAGIIGASQWWERKTPSDEDWAQTYAVNVRGMVMTSEVVSESMKARNYGKIINIASIAARQGSPDIPHYSTSKAAVVSWTQSHASQLASHNINVNAICPGLLWTPMFEAIVRKRAIFGAPDVDVQELAGRELFEKIVEETIPMKKEQTPEDIGKMTAFLASDDAHNITGQAINV